MPSNSSTALVASDSPKDDPELLALPAPPKRERWLTITLMVITGIAAGLLAWSLRSEARYALAASTPQDLGDLTAWSTSSSESNSYVAGTTKLLGTNGAIKYGRPAESDSFRLAPVAGNDKLWIEIRVPEGFEGPRFIPPNNFAGRLVPFSEAGLRHAGLRDSVKSKTGVDVPADAWILIDGSSPRASRWALALVCLFVAFAAWNFIGIVRLLARVRDGGAGAATAPPAGEGAT
ncbi:MAG: hypothetical protein HOW73_40245 [Polyangiaceae bacterium]|nr:hypothetical protein [Polyangiaceae bacterium]